MWVQRFGNSFQKPIIFATRFSGESQHNLLGIPVSADTLTLDDAALIAGQEGLPISGDALVQGTVIVSVEKAGELPEEAVEKITAGN